MIYLLDTNVCIRFLNGRAPNVRLRMATTPRSQIVVCSVVKTELWYGALKSQDPTRTRARQDRFLANFVSLDFDDVAAQQCALIRAQLVAQSVGPLDALIASISLANDLTLVTHNTREFGRINDLRIEDWE